MVAPVEKMPPATLEDEDQFEDFPSDALLGKEEILEVQKNWEDSWEEDDDAQDFAVQLK
jgi:hypothetical protein